MTLEFQIINDHVLDAIEQLDDDSIDCVVTSPPYWGLRNYGPGAITIWGDSVECDHSWDSISNNAHTEIWEDPGGTNICDQCGAWRGQLGLEPTPDMFIAHLVEVFDALRPKIKDTATLWVNLGDTYSGGGNASGHNEETTNGGVSTLKRGSVSKPVAQYMDSIKRKSQIGIPERFKVAMIDAGWVCRNTVIWHKPNPMPEKVSDRFTRNYEYIHFFTKNPMYYFKQQKEPVTGNAHPRRSDGAKSPKYADDMNGFNNRGSWVDSYQPDTRNMRSVWEVQTSSYKGAHFAVYPRELIEVPIRAGCPPDGTVLDPFCGSGTTIIEAMMQRKKGIGIEINPEYAALARQRIAEEIPTLTPLDDFFEEVSI